MAFCLECTFNDWQSTSPKWWALHSTDTGKVGAVFKNKTWSAFLLAKIFPKKIYIFKTKKWSGFQGFQSPKTEKKESIYFFQCVAKNIKNDDSKFVFHIWFIARFGWIFHSVNTTLVANKKIPLKIKNSDPGWCYRGRYVQKGWEGFGLDLVITTNCHQSSQVGGIMVYVHCILSTSEIAWYLSRASGQGKRPRGHLISQLPYPKVSFIIKYSSK